MKTVYLLLSFMLLINTQSSAQTWQWTHPESNNDINADNFAHDVEVDSSGNVYVLSFYRDSLFLDGTFRAKGTGSCIAKYNAAGTLLWYRLLTNTNAQQNAAGLIYASDMVVNAQGIFLSGCYSPPGTYLCQYNCLTGETTCYKPAYAIGSVNFTSQFGELGFFLTRFNTDGTVSWNKLGYSTASNCDLPFVAGLGGALRPLITSDKNNNITVAFIAGTYNGTPASISIGGDIIPLEANATASQLVTVKYNSTGVVQLSAHTNGGSYYGIVDYNSIVADNNGNIFIYGTAYDSTYFGSQLFRTSTPPVNGVYYQSTYIAKLSSQGVWLFAKELCNGSYNYLLIDHSYGSPDFLTVDDNNNMYALVNATNSTAPQIILGDTTGHTGGSNFLVKMTNNGDLVWDKFFGEEVYTYSQSICYANNSLYLNGRIYGVSDLIFSDLYTPNNIGQYFIAKTDLDGNFKWVTAFTADYRIWGLGVKTYQDNIYTCGTFSYQLTTLGNLNGAPSTSANYKIFSGKLKDQYIRVGAVSAKQVMPGCSITVPFTSTGLTFSAKNKFTAELSNASGDFTAPTVIGSVKSTGTGSIKATIPSSLAVGTSGYRIRIRSTDTLLTGFNYFAYADTGYALSVACPATATGLSATNITGTSATLNWAAVPCAAGYKVQRRVKGTTVWTTQNTSAAATSLLITGLTANTTYQWRIATKCNNNGVNSFSAFSPIQQFTTAPSFVVNRNTENIHAESNLKLSVQPNPAKSATTIVIGTTVKNAVIIVTDFVGKTVWKKTGVSAGRFALPVHNLTAGIYLIKLIDGNETSMVKFIKE